MNTFYNDVKFGLSNNPKRLYSKYFYNKKGDAIFQQLMHSSDYYLSRCELEILKHQSNEIADSFTQDFKSFDLIELGAGDASKSIFLLKALLKKKDVNFAYYPIDISSNVINTLEKKLPKKLPSLKIKGLNGEYLDMLKHQTAHSKQPKVILFLGSNIGNMPNTEALEFCKRIREFLNPNDLFFIGFDLKKSPKTVLAAYDDREGLTAEFNLNLLQRINDELNGNFNLNDFAHYCCYDPGPGECKSYLVSKKDQVINLGKGNDETSIDFSENEAIYMEISKKYDLQEIDRMADAISFKTTNHFLDNKKWFVDSLWKKEY